MEMYDRVWRVMRIPQIMGWWGIVLIQQTNATEAELPFRRMETSYFLSPARDIIDHGVGVWARW